MTKKRRTMVLASCAVAALLAGGYWLINRPDQRTDIEKASDALNEIAKGMKNASKEMDDRTLGQKLHDHLKEAGDNIKRDIKSTDNKDGRQSD